METVSEQAVDPAVESVPVDIEERAEGVVIPVVDAHTEAVKIEDTNQEHNAASLHVSNLSRYGIWNLITF